MRKEFLSSLIVIPPLLAPERFDQKMTFYLRQDCERFQLNFHRIIFTLGLEEFCKSTQLFFNARVLIS